MFEVLFRSVILVASAILWLSGLRLFLRAELSRRRRLVWTASPVEAVAIVRLTAASKIRTRAKNWKSCPR